MYLLIHVCENIRYLMYEYKIQENNSYESINIIYKTIHNDLLLHFNAAVISEHIYKRNLIFSRKDFLIEMRIIINILYFELSPGASVLCLSIPGCHQCILQRTSGDITGTHKYHFSWSNLKKIRNVLSVWHKVLVGFCRIVQAPVMSIWPPGAIGLRMGRPMDWKP